MSLFFDLLILVFLASSLALTLTTWRDRKKANTWESRHPAIAVVLTMVIGLSFLIVSWGSFVEPRLITINKVSIDLPNLEKSVKIALISDVHVGAYKKDGWIKKVSNKIKKNNPDLVLIAGDFIVNKSKNAKYLSSFESLAKEFPVYAVLGDHDYRIKSKNNKVIRVDEETANEVERVLEKAGVIVLRNEFKKINNNFILLGLDDWFSGKTKIPVIQTKLPILALAHNPDFILSPEAKNDALILSGNTHGGQIRLPWIGPIPPLPSNLPRSFDQGLFELQNNNKLFISSGISESGPRARLFNPPEIVLLNLY